MKVILLQDVPKLGKKFDVKEVAGGYARNFLIPKGLVKFADKAAVKNLEKQKKVLIEQQEQEKEQLQKQVKLLASQEFVFKVKTGEKDEIFGSVNKNDIEEQLREKGIEIKEIYLEKPIKTLGECEVEILLDFNIKTKIKIKVEKE